MNAEEPLFSSGLEKLEKTAANSGVDTRLIADITEKSHIIMKQLGLDIRDTTGKELYFALKTTIRQGIGDMLLCDSDYVLVKIDDKIISFNLLDMIDNAHHELSFENQIATHGQRSLRGELVARYINHKCTDNKATLDIAQCMGLLPDSDACYTNAKYQQKHTMQKRKESIK